MLSLDNSAYDAAKKYEEERNVAQKETLWLGNNEVITYFSFIRKANFSSLKRYKVVKISFMNAVDFSQKILANNLVSIEDVRNVLNSYKKEFELVAIEKKDATLKKRKYKYSSKFKLKDE